MAMMRNEISITVCLLLCGMLFVSTSVAETAVGLETPPPGRISAANKRKLRPMIDAAAKRHGVDRDLVHAVIAAESGYNPAAVSRAGAIGLMQVMPATAADYGVRAAGELFAPETNVNVGTRHLKRLITKYRSVGQAIAAYNAGEDVARLWLSYCFSQEPEEYFTKVGYRQTRAYLDKVLTSRAQYPDIYSEHD